MKKGQSPDFGAGFGAAGAPSEDLVALATQTLGYFEEAAATAEADLAQLKGASPNALASVNTLTGPVLTNLAGISEETRRNLETVIAQPAIARVEVLNEQGGRELIFITPGGAPRGRWGDVRVASYRSPMGRLAAIRVGQDLDVRLPEGVKAYELVGRAQLHPERPIGEWDSRNTIIEALAGKPLTVVSLRALLRGPPPDDAALALLESLLSKGAHDQNIYEGLRRTVLDRIGLRERPVLDEYQDEIFRLPLASRVAILGPPGSGKTTTLIKRLGLKLDLQVLEDDRAVIDRAVAGQRGHATSWLMFSPTELLRQYVKEAFGRERVPASDREIHVWDSYRRETGRNRLGILRTANSKGVVLKDGLQNLRPETIGRQIDWFEDFDAWQKDLFWSELKDHVDRLGGSEDAATRALASRLSRIVEAGAARDTATPFVQFRAMSREVRDHAAELQRQIDDRLRTAFARELQKDQTLLARLSAFLSTLAETAEPDDSDEPELDEEEDDAAPATRAAVEHAFEAYLRAMRGKARALANGRRLGARTRNARVAEWLGPAAPSDDDLRPMGAAVNTVTSLRRLANPMRSYLNSVSIRYRRFRRLRTSEDSWYLVGPYGSADLSPLEVDVVMLAMLRTGRTLLGDPRIAAAVDEDSITTLQAVRELFRTQVLVDEATDFSPIQLACMGALSDPAINAFLACGDFNQRITNWGTRSEAELKWVFSDIDIRTIRITYRHSRQLNALAHRIAQLSDNGHQAAALPEHVDNEGFDPVLGLGLGGEDLVVWLRDRILEIERLTGSLPSIAVLVNQEAEVQPLADALQRALADHNIQCSACPNGQVRGNDNDVRVFDVQHIKGLEFEAVFFAGVDQLAKNRPELFDKFLYVGATRAAMYFGLTSASASLPTKLAPLQDAFTSTWSA